jgi:2-polyprenyl-3-methyl-5-hydroxy-6-metoxy-1,4-benzoquinol methylase
MERFAFGENWRNFSKRLTGDNFLNTKKSVRELVGDLTGKAVLDIGCGYPCEYMSVAGNVT